MTKQSYQIEAKPFTEKYSYNNNDGSMTSMTTANGDNLNFSYDSIKRLYGTAAKTGSTRIIWKEYGYRTISGNQTTTQVSSPAYSGFTGAANLPLRVYGKRQYQVRTVAKQKLNHLHLRHPRPVDHGSGRRLGHNLPLYL